MTDKELHELILSALDEVKADVKGLDKRLTAYAEAATTRHTDCREGMLLSLRNGQAAINELRFRLVYYLSIPAGLGAAAGIIYAFAKLLPLL